MTFKNNNLGLDLSYCINQTFGTLWNLLSYFIPGSTNSAPCVHMYIFELIRQLCIPAFDYCLVHISLKC